MAERRDTPGVAHDLVPGIGVPPARKTMRSPETNGSSPVHAIPCCGAGDRASRAVSCPMAAVTTGRLGGRSLRLIAADL